MPGKMGKGYMKRGMGGGMGAARKSKASKGLVSKLGSRRKTSQRLKSVRVK